MQATPRGALRVHSRTMFGLRVVTPRPGLVPLALFPTLGIASMGDTSAPYGDPLIFLFLGTIFLGIATPTEGGAMGAAGALILAIMRKRLSWKLLRQAMETTGKLTSFVVFILASEAWRSTPT